MEKLRFSFVLSIVLPGIILAANYQPYQKFEPLNSKVPWHAGLVTTWGEIVCGGSIVSENVVITSSLCLRYLKRLTASFVVIAGTQSRHDIKQTYFVLNIEVTKHYFLYDIAMINTSPNFKFGTLIQPIGLINKHLHPGTGPMIVAGWGSYGPDWSLVSEDLLVSENNFVNISSKEMPGLLSVSNEKKDWACNGDQGGGLVYRNRLVGVFALGPLECGDADERIYSDIVEFRQEIIAFIRRFGEYSETQDDPGFEEDTTKWITITREVTEEIETETFMIGG